MPYDVSKSGGGFDVINENTGTVYGHHKTKESAERQLALLRMIKQGKKLTKTKKRSMA